MSAETFLVLTVLAHLAHSRFFTANALYKLLTYLLYHTSYAVQSALVTAMPLVVYVEEGKKIAC